ncbi:MAG TPA: succinate dehydrogenase assembly factor 2 [Casimicrobium sp.]|nr:succinate dehydrogenase assembly factor 2 [Casimicrobium sp.]
MLTDLEHSKLRWRCRRGFLENDLILTRLLERRNGDFSADEHTQLLALIALDDNDLWEIIAGRSNTFPEGTDEMVATLRQTRVNQ